MHKRTNSLKAVDKCDKYLVLAAKGVDSAVSLLVFLPWARWLLLEGSWGDQNIWEAALFIFSELFIEVLGKKKYIKNKVVCTQTCLFLPGMG